MLEEMRIRGLGVIADATVPLDRGLTVVTGETGAGKTMLLAGLGLLFGGRADSSRVRTGERAAVIEGRLRLTPGSAALDRVIEAGAEVDEDGALLLSRTVTPEGRTRAHAGGRSVPVGVLAALGEEQLAVHGQSDQIRLLRPSEQRAALDRYGGPAVADVLDRHRETFARWRQLADDHAERTAHTRERQQEAALLQHGLNEIAAVDPQPGEDETLRAEAMRLEHADALRQAATAAHEALSADDAGLAGTTDVATLLSAAQHALTAVADADPDLAALGARLAEAAYTVADVAAELASYGQALDADPVRLDGVHERRAALLTLTRRYAESIDGVLAWAQSAAARVSRLDSSEAALEELARRRDETADELRQQTTALSAARCAAAAGLGDAISAELAGLAMVHSSVSVCVTARSAIAGAPTLTIDGEQVGVGPDGGDEVELLLRPHAGAEPQPLQRGASGGELSRVMLAVEVVLADDDLPTMVFDEVDAGVGGRAAVEVGRRLARLAANHQVLVVTHLPQVAAYADTHLVVDKDSDGAVTASGVRVVTGAERTRELARMLAGLDGSDIGAAHAEELLAAAAAHRAEDRAGPAVASGARANARGQKRPKAGLGKAAVRAGAGTTAAGRRRAKSA